ncbi:uncharacterized protein M437DRAFT_69898 [Aureobasidium melanogenum CBS 110374]|uniref:Uncharacterized protein n=1 Tax=Aureobasidium melanogenum (strain CBS 110374) TaxID=1043003 RepID=A0A074VCY1_AURM1|nr:uncharacterized protein M437DRAFT_69898 [Aureobasidium melanogenum CBS 110374]KEQ58555.1 hypothetical protein M437DRAFT_69898 [Aureobasidium melanogenum CBS 110374]
MAVSKGLPSTMGFSACLPIGRAHSSLLQLGRYSPASATRPLHLAAVALWGSLPQVQTSCSSWPQGCVALSIFDLSPRQLHLGSASACSRRGNREQNISWSTTTKKTFTGDSSSGNLYIDSGSEKWEAVAQIVMFKGYQPTRVLFCLRALSASLSARLLPQPRGKKDLTRHSHSADGEMSRNNGVQSTRPLFSYACPCAFGDSVCSYAAAPFLLLRIEHLQADARSFSTVTLSRCCSDEHALMVGCKCLKTG